MNYHQNYETIKLLPCPCCGNKAKWEKQNKEDLDDFKYGIMCSHCTIFTGMSANKDFIIKMWNTRPPNNATEESIRAILDLELRLFYKKKDWVRYKTRVTNLLLELVGQGTP